MCAAWRCSVSFATGNKLSRESKAVTVVVRLAGFFFAIRGERGPHAGAIFSLRSARGPLHQFGASVVIVGVVFPNRAGLSPAGACVGAQATLATTRRCPVPFLFRSALCFCFAVIAVQLVYISHALGTAILQVRWPRTMVFGWRCVWVCWCRIFGSRSRALSAVRRGGFKSFACACVRHGSRLSSGVAAMCGNLVQSPVQSKHGQRPAVKHIGPMRSVWAADTWPIASMTLAFALIQRASHAEGVRRGAWRRQRSRRHFGELHRGAMLRRLLALEFVGEGQRRRAVDGCVFWGSWWAKACEGCAIGIHRRGERNLSAHWGSSPRVSASSSPQQECLERPPGVQRSAFASHGYVLKAVEA